MKYGFFDEKQREYIITRPDTPSPWTNYLGNSNYGALITNNAAGYSFEGSGADGKILRFRFNAPMSQMPGRYLYLRDYETGDYWSASWQPVGKSLTKYKSVCKHGLGYTIINSEYDSIKMSTIYYVPIDKSIEVWRIVIANNDTKSRKLSVFSYVEFTNHNVEEMDMNNLQYSQYISRAEYKNNCILQKISENSNESCYRFMGIVGSNVYAWDTDRDVFLGLYGSYSKPDVVASGNCKESECYAGNACGSFQVNLDLKPSEEKEIVFIIGVGDEEKAKEVIDSYKEKNIVDEIDKIKAYWERKLNRFQIDTPSKSLNNMINTWHSFECIINTYWSRTASLIYSKGRNGYGYRDTIADLQSIMHLDVELSKEKLIIVLTGQLSNGGALPLISFNHKPGAEISPDSIGYGERTGYSNYRCDDTLWLFPAIRQYVYETGDKEFLKTILPYADSGEAEVYDHLVKAIYFILASLGKHGLVTAIDNDWNDCLKLGKDGESVFATFQFYHAITILLELTDESKKTHVEWLTNIKETIQKSLDKCWDGDQYIRAITERGDIIGRSYNNEASLWLNPQTWSIISGIASEKQAITATEKVYRELRTRYGAVLFSPAYKSISMPEIKMNLYPEGIKENASIFIMAEAWLIQAECMLGHGNRAWEYYISTNPAFYNEDAETHVTEPYVYSQFIDGKESPTHGKFRGHWLTGAASSILLAVIEWILGVRAEQKGLMIDPCIPSSWDGFSMKRIFRGKKIDFNIINPEHIEHGVKSVKLNDIEMKKPYIISSDMLRDENRVYVVMGKE